MPAQMSLGMYKSVWATAVSLALFLTLVSASSAATLVLIDQDTTIDASNSLPEPPLSSPHLFVELRAGSSGSPTVELKEGGVIGGSVNVGDESHLIVTGGQIESFTRVTDRGMLTLSGGRIAPLIRSHAADDIVGILDIADEGTLNLRGGDAFGIIFQHDSSVINIFGYGFDVEGEIPTSNDARTVRVTGFSPNGSPLAIEIGRRSANAQVFLHTVPEPSCCGLAAIALTGSVAYFRR